MSSNPIVIVAAKRTPIGAFQGTLSAAAAPELGAAAIAGVIDETGIDPADIDQVFMGCVLPAGLGQAPARQAALAGGIPVGTPCTTINKMCSPAAFRSAHRARPSTRCAAQACRPSCSGTI